MTSPQTDGSAAPPEASLTRLGDAACDRFEAAWRAGQRPRLEEYLAAVPEPQRPALLRELLLLEIDYRRLAGERPTPEEYLARFPTLDPAWLTAALTAAVPPAPRAIVAGDAATVPGPSGAPDGPGMPVPGYEVLGELGRGGMGVVYKARDTRLNRLVALKRIRAGGHADPEERARIRREAEAVARLQHPHIVQIYEIGEHGGSPFLALEYLEGGSLEDRLRGAPLPPGPAARLVATVARALHAAHGREVVHRDLKPANVLLTTDGTPKVADFGLAKRLDAAGSQTHSGVIVGTPPYMAPEQAAGRQSAVTPRTDVYALGALLYELLTGRPPFRAASAVETLQQVLQDEPVPPRRLQPKTPRDLETVCLKCLRKEPPKRYGSAEAVAEDLERFLAGEPVVARPVGLAERALKWVRRRPAAAGLWAALALLVGLGGGFGWWLRQEHAAAADRREQTEHEARLVMGQARALLDAGWRAHDPARLAEARAAADRAAAVAGSGDASASVRQEAAALQREAAARIGQARQNAALVTALLDIHLTRETETYQKDEQGQVVALTQPSEDEQFAAAFRRWGVDVGGEPVARAVARLGAQPEPVVQDIVAGLDAWALERRRKQRPEPEWRRLLEVARRLDRDGLRKEVRELLAAGPLRRTDAAATAWDRTRTRLRELAGRSGVSDSALGVLALARVLVVFGDEPAAEELLRSSLAEHPGEESLLHALARLLEEQRPRRLAEAVGYYRAARAVRPQLGVALGRALVALKQAAEGEAVLRDLLRRLPDNPEIPFYLGDALAKQRKWPQAEAAHRQSLGLRPHYLTYNHLANALHSQDRLAQAANAYRKSLELKPDYAETHNDLGLVLKAQGKLGEAVEAYRKALGLRPGFAAAHNNLGLALHGYARMYRGYGLVTQVRQKLVEAAESYHRAIRSEPRLAAPHSNLGLVLHDQGKLAEAAAAHRRALEVEPDYVGAYLNLGITLMAQGKPREAVNAYRHAIRLRPDFSEAYNNLGAALYRQYELGEAEVALRWTLALKADFAQPHYNLGKVLRARHRPGEAAAAFREAARLAPQDWSIRESLRRAERLIELAKKYPSIPDGGGKATGPREQLELAEVCSQARGYHRAAVRLAATAFAADPKLAEDLRARHRFDAACAAALAAAGRGADAAGLAQEERARLRRQALEWLRAEVVSLTRHAGKGPLSRIEVGQLVRSWWLFPELAGVRDPDRLATLPPAEREDWRRLWADVDALIPRELGAE